MTSLALICIALSQLLLLLANANDVNPTKGFISLPFNTSFYHIQKPYNKRVNQRYSFVKGVHKFWVFANDKPHTTTSKTHPRTEMAIQGYGYSSGVWQFQGDAYVPKGTSGVCIMQVFGANAPYATTLMLRVYNGSLMHYKFSVLVPNIYDRWFRVNVIHNVDANKVMVYIDGELKLKVKGRGGTSHAFKCGVYAQDRDSVRMESRWKNIKVLRQST
ncbi:citrate-binding protein-like [Heracleum sosnowskyi]|uniref:Citrate-binding protein-like n=1 Tax=Heracleum sosnowskyi TaxID=360622 RepID=A0AAD8HQM7_9APIA|nr:citrate-binding protein-like [Heracleum sosnowskyi]